MNSYIVLQNQFNCNNNIGIHWNQRPVNNNTTKYKLSFDRVVKYILIYFTPSENVDFWQMNENYPYVCKATLYLNGKNTLEFENEDLLDFEIFGIKVYLLPLCK
jgi:hypothetical protein